MNLLDLKEVEQCRSVLYPGEECSFSGRFFLSRADHTGIPAVDNLGCHLSQFANMWRLLPSFQAWFVVTSNPMSALPGLTVALDGAAFPFDLNFASCVAAELEKFKKRGSA